jgi:tRNA (cytidine/uridine-2'-O-)-methyltransferase
MLNVVLYEPEIPSNTGNIMRLCANMGANLHLIKPYGFALDDKKLRRAGLDYRDLATVKEYENFADFLAKNPNANIFCLTTKTNKLYTSVEYKTDDFLMFGPETRGLPADLMDKFTKLTLPMMPDSRSLNLSNSVAIASYEMWRQLDFSFKE